MPTLVATRAFPYGRKRLQIGEEFEATEKDAKLFLKMRRATEPPERPKHVDVAPPPPKTMKPVEEPAPDPLPEAGRYQRRDMRAEDGRTGKAKPAPSSRPARRPKKRT